MERAAAQQEFPVGIVVLALQLYQATRVLQWCGFISEPVDPLRSVGAGEVHGNLCAKLALRWIWERRHIMHPEAPVLQWVDDLFMKVAGTAKRVAMIFPAALADR